MSAPLVIAALEEAPDSPQPSRNGSRLAPPDASGASSSATEVNRVRRHHLSKRRQRTQTKGA